ncbi:hypothetical protein GMD53_09355 [Ruthenibacterium lactatiformans]|nr:hypothetical protein [Ruthenibacterium lactatiformans]
MWSYLVLTGPFLGIYYIICSSFLQASGNAKLTAIVFTLWQGLFLIPLLYLMAPIGMMGNVWARLTADLAAAVAALVIAIQQYRKVYF